MKVTARRGLETMGTFRSLQELSSPTSQPVGLPEGPDLVFKTPFYWGIRSDSREPAEFQ
jgi:hypothetical protein